MNIAVEDSLDVDDLIAKTKECITKFIESGPISNPKIKEIILELLESGPKTLQAYEDLILEIFKDCIEP